jgi:peptide/nickel transport system substrate-binding protein
LSRKITDFDGKPFTAVDVKCTWDLLLGKAKHKLRVNPRKSWYRNLAEVTTNGDYEVTFRLERPQPGFVALLASGYSVVSSFASIQRPKLRRMWISSKEVSG